MTLSIFLRFFTVNQALVTFSWLQTSSFLPKNEGKPIILSSRDLKETRPVGLHVDLYSVCVYSVCVCVCTVCVGSPVKPLAVKQAHIWAPSQPLLCPYVTPFYLKILPSASFLPLSTSLALPPTFRSPPFCGRMTLQFFLSAANVSLCERGSRADFTLCVIFHSFIRHLL